MNRIASGTGVDETSCCGVNLAFPRLGCGDLGLGIGFGDWFWGLVLGFGFRLRVSKTGIA